MEIYTVDSFTDVAFAGNPAGVCLLDEPRPDAWMASVAAEMNLSETAFVLRGPDRIGLRWFTPAVEVRLCGHATLATAHVLYEVGEQAEELTFDTLSGELRARRSGNQIVLDFPAQPPEAAGAPPELVELLGETPSYFGVHDGSWVAVLEREQTIREFQPDSAVILGLPARVLIVSAPADPGGGFDFVSRVFGPAVGIPEDPVTGSAHCVLGPYWGSRLGKSDLVAYQASRRGGTIGVGLRGDRVELLGSAVTVLRGELA